MLLREDERGVLVIGQPAHAWVAGQLARVWGNEQFGPVEPAEEVCLAADQHDVGWAGRDLEPIFNPETGLPLSFTEMPLEIHLELWSEGPARLVSQSRYAALLVSMHGWRLYERRNLDRLPNEEARAIARFLAAQREFQMRLWQSLRAEANAGDHISERAVERNSLLIWTWDYLSLALCLGWSPATARGAPTAGRPTDLELTRDEESGRHLLHPWPFGRPTVSVGCEGRRLAGPVDSAAELIDAFSAATWERLELTLEPR